MSQDMSLIGESSQAIKVIKFNGNNFSLWKLKIIALLEIWDLLEVVETPISSIAKTKLSLSTDDSSGSSSTASTSAASDEKKKERELELQRKSKKAYAILINCLRDEQLQLVQHIAKGNAHEVWTTLLQRYESKTTASKSHARDMLHQCKKDSKETFDTYVSRIIQAMISLEEMGEKISEGELMYVLLNGLPSDYDSLVQTLRVNDKIKFNEACQHIREYEEAQKFKAVKSEEEVAHQAKEGDHKSEKQKAKKDKYRGRSKSANSNDRNKNCYVCGRSNHLAKDCFMKDKTCNTCNKTGHISFTCFKNKDKKKCDKCRKIGHTKEECRFNKNKSDNKESDKNEDEHDSDGSYFAVAAFNKNEGSNSSWILDSGATRHITNNKSLAEEVNKAETETVLTIANDDKIKLSETGKVKLVSGGKKKRVTLNKVLYAPKFASNLLSLVKIVDTKSTILFTQRKAIIRDPNGKKRLIVPRVGNLFVVDQQRNGNALQAAELNSRQNQMWLWHYRLGHIAVSSMKKLKDRNSVYGIEQVIVDTNNTHICEGCALGKEHRKPFKNYTVDKVEKVLDRVHSDLCGPMHTESIGGNKYLMTIIDERSRRKVGLLLKRKSDAKYEIIGWCDQAVVEIGTPLKIWRSDGGGEYTDSELQEYFKSKGIKVEMTLPGTPQHNGIAERANRTIIEAARSMLQHAKLTEKFWGLAVLAAIYIGNRCLTTADHKKTPEEIWSGKKPTIKHLRVFGCDAYVHVRDANRRKLEAKATKCIFVGYDEKKKGYRLYDVVSKKLISSRDVSFNEMSFTFGRKIEADGKFECRSEIIKLPFEGKSGSTEVKSQPQEMSDVTGDTNRVIPDPEEKYNDDTGFDGGAEESETQIQPEVDQSQIEKRLRPTDGNQYPLCAGPKETRRAINLPKKFDNFELSQSCFSVIEEPLTYEEAMNGEEARLWKKAADKEMNSLIENNTWTLVKLPEGKTAIGAKWVFKKKINKEGEVERYKARFCAKGYSQEKGIDYNETFAPVLKYKSLRIILAIAAIRDLELSQMDVETAFLNAEIKEEVYMEQPEGYEKGGENIVCKLNKTLYGTKQAPNEWNHELSDFIVSLGFKRCRSDTCVYMKTSKTGKTIIVAIFVDDIISAYSIEDEQEWLQYKAKFLKAFKIKDLGIAEWILGIRITRNRKEKTIILDQEVYINKILKKFNMNDSKPVDTPEVTSKILSLDDCPNSDEEKQQMKNVPYQSLVGALLYASTSTRPDIAHAVNMVSRYMQNPGHKHWIAGKRILRYLNGTNKLGLVYDGKNQKDLIAYADSDWAGDLDKRQSTTGYTVMINNCVISWASKKQETVSLSSAEAEYMAISAVVQEIKWVTQLLEELDFKQKDPIKVYIDNKAAIAIGENDVKHCRTKHIDIRHHFIREAVKNKEIKLLWIRSEEQLADMHTKALNHTLFVKCRDKIMTKDIKK